MKERTTISLSILKELINSDTFAPEITDADVEESLEGHLIKQGSMYVALNKNTLQGRKRFRVINPEAIYVRSAVKFADELIKQTK